MVISETELIAHGSKISFYLNAVSFESVYFRLFTSINSSIRLVLNEAFI